MRHQKSRILYRRFLRACYKVGSAGKPLEQSEMISQVRSGFNKQLSLLPGQSSTDAEEFSYKLGLKELKALEKSVGLYSVDLHDKVAAKGGESGGGWMDIKDDEDKRGRVGVEWPWQRKTTSTTT